MPIYKRKNDPSGNWYIDYYLPNGSRIQRSAKTKNKRQAQELHDRLKAEAWRQHHIGDVKPRHTWQEAVVRYLKEQSEKKSLVTDKYHLRWLDSHLSSLFLDDINKSMLEVIKEEKRKTGASNATVNRVLATVKKILNAAKNEWEWLDTVPTVKMLTEPNARVRWLSEDEEQRLFEQLPTHLAAMTRFSLATGLRESNVTGLQWSQIDIQRQCAWIHASQSKNKKPISVPLNETALSVIREQMGKHLTHVFTYKSKPIAKAGSTAWQNALAQAQIDNFRWHDLRHTWATRHVMAGTPLHILKELGGWHSIEMVMVYAHLSSDHLKGFAENANTVTKKCKREEIEVIETKLTA